MRRRWFLGAAAGAAAALVLPEPKRYFFGWRPEVAQAKLIEHVCSYQMLPHGQACSHGLMDDIEDDLERIRQSRWYTEMLDHQVMSRMQAPAFVPTVWDEQVWAALQPQVLDQTITIKTWEYGAVIKIPRYADLKIGG